MKIKCSNKSVRFVFQRDISSDRIVFDKRGHATVSTEVGEALVELYPEIASVKSAKTEEE